MPWGHAIAMVPDTARHCQTPSLQFKITTKVGYELDIWEKSKNEGKSWSERFKDIWDSYDEEYLDRQRVRDLHDRLGIPGDPFAPC